MGAIFELREFLECPSILRSHRVPTDAEDIEDPPAILRDRIRLAEEFRSLALPALGREE